MSNNEDYNKGYQDGYWFGNDDAYRQGYEEGKQAERSRIKRAIDGDDYKSEPSTLVSMVFGSIILVILGWCLVGLILFLFWIGGQSSSWWFPWIWRIAFWGGVGFIALMSIAGIVMSIIEYRETKNPPEEPIDDPNLPLYKKYSPADVIKVRKK